MTLAPLSTLVACNSASGAELLARCNVKDALLSFSGNDALVLRCGGNVLDSIGQVGMNPGTAWGAGAITTADHTLRRRPHIFVGRPTATAPFDPAQEWDSFVKDTFLDLGKHSVALGDQDNDGVIYDNCPFHANQDQSDADLDGYGDVCDNCPWRFNPGQEDADADGTGDACET